VLIYSGLLYLIVKNKQNESTRGTCLKLLSKLSTTLSKIYQLYNKENASVILEFYEFMEENGTSKRDQNNNLNAIIAYSNYIQSKVLTHIYNKKDVLMTGCSNICVNWYNRYNIG
jgi:hypothetical protein